MASLAQAFVGLPVIQTNRQTDPRDCDVSTADTIEVMTEIARSYKQNPIVEAAVNKAVQDLSPDANDTEVVRAIYYWVKRTLTFSEDEELMRDALGLEDLDKDLIITPDLLLSMSTPTGDCDDYSTLLATMLGNLGFQCWYVTIAADGTTPDRFSHVYVKVWIDDRQIEMNLDSSHGIEPGWEYKEYTRRKEWKI